MPTTVRNLWAGIHASAKVRIHRNHFDLSASHDLLKKNAMDTSLSVQTLTLMLEFQDILSERLAELDNEREEFWNLPHRAPDYYARAIALRLAKLFAKETGRRPTYGLSGETGEPSAAFSRALREVFIVLGITAQQRGPAEWAVGQISEDDLEPKEKKSLNALIDMLSPDSSEKMGIRLGPTPLSKTTKI